MHKPHIHDNQTEKQPAIESGPSLWALSLPKGGGAIKGIGDKFSANPVTGTGSLSVPIFGSAGRSGFSPQLSLSYDSGAGNGPFGFGWRLSVASITRKTDKGLPRYRDDEDSDIFILSDTEDLVPALANGTRDVFPATLNGVEFTVQRYLPRIEGLFARIERWRKNANGDTHWRLVSKDNLTSIYGQSANSRITDPENDAHVFTWLLELSYDDKGNIIAYEYKAEDPTNVARSLDEEHRSVTANRYLKQIKYGNEPAYYPDHVAAVPVPLPTQWRFHVVFDYGDHDLAVPRVDEESDWPSRPDPFSTYRAGFEIRTYRLCRRVLMFHQFAELGASPCLVRSTDFDYNRGPVASFLTSVIQRGYIRSADTGTYEITDARTGELLSPMSQPPVEFTYSEARIDDDIRLVDAGSLENLPEGLDGTRHRWIDLHSEGLPGILIEQAYAWFYKRNLSNLLDGEMDPPTALTARFGPLEVVATKPSLAVLAGGQQQLMDLAGNGQLCLVQFSQPVSGFHEREANGQWQPFTPFTFSPNIEWNDANLRSIDLDGDGHADILITEDEVFTWYPSRAKDGFGPAETVRKAADEEKGPALVFADATQSIYLADFSGDGLTDIVRIRNGEVCYWPNLGYGRFGAKVTMDNAPVFDQPDQFEQKRLRLADIDGSGTTDIIYLGGDGVALWFNQSGNSWSAPRRLSQFPKTDNVSSVMALDLLGNGTACLVWSSSLLGDARRPMRYIDLMGGQKPHLLISVKNNLGAETRVQYAASTRFYLRDRAEGNPWITRLPFPVHVVERVETYDHVSKTKLVTLYKYHHGYFDGPEREFRGFGMVEQLDTESFSRFSGAGLFTETPDTADEEFHLPAVHTKTWFHNGAYMAQERISRHYEVEYYHGDRFAKPLPDTILPSGLTTQEEREACRALKGRVLRQEVYADDTSAHRADPYSVTEHSYHLRLVQPQQGNRHAVFYAHESEALEYHYERNPDDPRLTQKLTLEVDEFGNVTRSAAVAYPRRPLLPSADEPRPPDHPSEQRQPHIVYTESDFTTKVDTGVHYHAPVPSEVRTYELTGLPSASEDDLNTGKALLRAAAQAAEIQYEDSPDGVALQKRLIERVRTLYSRNDLSGPLPPGRLEWLALPFESYKLAFTPGLLGRVYGGKLIPAEMAELLSSEGQYRNLDGDGAWWIPADRVFFSPDPVGPDPSFARSHFYLPQGSVDPFGNLSRVTHDRYDLLIDQTEDALGNRLAAHNDYRVMQPDLVTDPNENRSAVRFDALGMVVTTAVMGKAGASEGDTLDDPTTRLEYELFNWMRNGRPNFVHTFAREQHGPANPRWQESFGYSDGAGREAMKKIQAEPGRLRQCDATGNVVEVDTSPAPRWVGTGRTIFDNKGNPVKKYEQFFSATPEYETEEAMICFGVTPILRYDPLSRLIRTDMPNGTFSKTEFDPWQQTTWDENDTVRQSRWYVERGSPDFSGRSRSDPEARAAWLAAGLANTPTVAQLDTLGRPFLTIADNGGVEKYETRVELDIEGNQRAVIDALERTVMRYDYDMLGAKVFQHSMDAGERWTLNNVAGHPIRAWDSRNHVIRTTYDQLQRPTQLFVPEGDVEKLVGRIVYGEPGTADRAADADAKRLNLRGKVRRHYDGAGLATNEEFDFKGNLLRTTRQFAIEYRRQLDWSASPAPALRDETFSTSITYDALNRPVTQTMPDRSVIRPGYNEANLLDRVSVSLRGAATETIFVSNIDYDAKGQPRQIVYGNRARTEYAYDPLTFLLKNLLTTRSRDSNPLQDLRFTYDPVGNITAIRDAAQQTIFFRNTIVEPSAEYEYDALYRLTSATGREHLGQGGSGRLNSPRQTDHDDSFRTNLPHPGDGNAMGNYTERYEYDAVGNILRMIHEAGSAGSWTRRYAYAEPSVIEPLSTNNRLSRTSLPGDPSDGPYSARYSYDAHGNMISMTHLPTMEWDFKDQLRATRQQVVADGGTGETVYYVYDSGGQRVRKIIESPGGTIKQERLYVGGFELYRERDSRGITLERETLHVVDDQRRIAIVETKTIDQATAPFTPTPLIRYQLSNHLGSASLELDGAGEIISYEEYYPYGSTSYQAVRSGVEADNKRYRYTGKERDEETGLYYNGARYYACWLGRWTSTDPAGIVDGPNVYRYASGNPVRFKDSTGLQTERLVQHFHGGVSQIMHEHSLLARMHNYALPEFRLGLNNAALTNMRQEARAIINRYAQMHQAGADLITRIQGERNILQGLVSRGQISAGAVADSDRLRASVQRGQQVIDEAIRAFPAPSGLRGLPNLGRDPLTVDPVLVLPPPAGRPPNPSSGGPSGGSPYGRRGSAALAEVTAERRAAGALERAGGGALQAAEHAALSASARSGARAAVRATLREGASIGLRGLPFLGAAVGGYSVGTEAAEGHYLAATLAGVESFVPGGELVAVAHVTYIVAEQLPSHVRRNTIATLAAVGGGLGPLGVAVTAPVLMGVAAAEVMSWFH